MILHASFTVDQPRAAAEALAWIMGGQARPLPDFGRDAWMAFAGDSHGTLIQLLRRGTEFHYVEGATVAHRHGHPIRESGFHILLETRHAEEAVLAEAARFGCRAHLGQHGPLSLIEFWIEGDLLVEVVTPDMAVAYRRLASAENLAAMPGASQ